MKRVAGALVVLGLAAGATGASAKPFAVASTFRVEGGFCSGAPDSVDSRIATAVGAPSVFVNDTPPIAILDTGVSDNVTELQGRIVDPFDAATGGTDGSDVNGRGSELAGIAAGTPGLVEGVSPTSPIMPIRVFNRTGTAAIEWMVGGINWAVGHGATVIEISSSSPLSDASAAEITSLTRATTDAFNKGVLVVVSAGNAGNSAPQFPGSLPHVLTVGGSDLTGARATFSNFGPWIDLVAPVSSLVGPTPKDICPSGYGVVNDTAFAAPSVAGAAAIIAKARPELSVQQRFDLLRTSAHDTAPAGRDDDTGFGLLNVQAALTAPAPAVEASREVDDDPYYVRGPNAPGHPTLLTKTKKVRVSGVLSPAKDPSDVYPVRLNKGERLTVSANVAGADSLVGLGIWNPAVGDFDVSNEVTKQEAVSTGGFASDPQLKFLAKKTGTYFISVEATDAVDEDDPTAVVPVTEAYQLLVTKVKVPAKKPKKKSSKKTKKK